MTISSKVVASFSGDGKDWERAEWALLSPGRLLPQGARVHN